MFGRDKRTRVLDRLRRSHKLSWDLLLLCCWECPPISSPACPPACFRTNWRRNVCTQQVSKLRAKDIPLVKTDFFLWVLSRAVPSNQTRRTTNKYNSVGRRKKLRSAIDGKSYLQLFFHISVLPRSSSMKLLRAFFCWHAFMFHDLSHNW